MIRQSRVFPQATEVTTDPTQSTESLRMYVAPGVTNDSTVYRVSPQATEVATDPTQSQESLKGQYMKMGASYIFVITCL